MSDDTANAIAVACSSENAEPPSWRTVNLAFLTQPSIGVFVLNLQFETGEAASRIKMTKAQLSNIIVDGAGMILRPCEGSR